MDEQVSTSKVRRAPVRHVQRVNFLRRVSKAEKFSCN